MIQGRRGREVGDALSEVAEGVALLGHQLSNEGHEPVKIKIPEQLPGHGWGAEFQKAENTARFQDSGDFPEAGVAIRKVPQTKGDGDGIEGAVGEGKFEGVCLGQVQ